MRITAFRLPIISHLSRGKMLSTTKDILELMSQMVNRPTLWGQPQEVAGMLLSLGAVVFAARTKRPIGESILAADKMVQEITKEIPRSRVQSATLCHEAMLPTQKVSFDALFQHGNEFIANLIRGLKDCDVICCSQFRTSWEGDSPFLENTVFGYYDGPTDGFVRCIACLKDYKYDLLAWDKSQDTRLFALYELPSGSFGVLEKLLGRTGRRRFPEWIPTRDEKLDELWREIDALLAEMQQEMPKAEYLVLGTSPTGVIRIRRVDDHIERRIKRRQDHEIDDLDTWISLIG